MSRCAVAAVLAAMFGSACAAGGFGAPAPQAALDERLIVPASFDRSWSVVVRTLFELNVPIRTIEKASGLLETEELRTEVGRGCDCGTYLGIPIGGYGTYGGDAHFRYRLLLEPEGADRTAITLRSTCVTAIPDLPQLSCRLDPAKEKALWNQIQSRIIDMAGRRSDAPSVAPGDRR